VNIIVDTSVWSLALRRKDAPENSEATLLRRLLERGEGIYLIGIILQEVLQGIRRPEDFHSLGKYFEAFPLIELSRDDYIRAAGLKNSLIKKGIQASTVDALIASAAITHGCVLFTADKDFSDIARHSKLKLLKEE
jgi:predicted nucleic acid-binding protein